VQWAEAAASKGYAADEYLLGLLYLWGTGATTDEMMAEKLFLKAEEKGFDAALAELSQIYMGKNRKALTDSLSGSSVKLNFRDAYF
jgi:TPR repeat protein